MFTLRFSSLTCFVLFSFFLFFWASRFPKRCKSIPHLGTVGREPSTRVILVLLGEIKTAQRLVFSGSSWLARSKPHSTAGNHPPVAMHAWVPGCLTDSICQKLYDVGMRRDALYSANFLLAETSNAIASQGTTRTLWRRCCRSTEKGEREGDEEEGKFGCTQIRTGLLENNRFDFACATWPPTGQQCSHIW